MKLLTNLIFEPKGMHNQNVAYNIKDTVMSADGSRVYFALQDVPAGITLDNEDYWKLQIDLSASKAAMDEAVANFADYAKQVGTKVRGETARASGNPVTFLPDAGSLLQPVTVLEPQQQGSGDPYPAGGGKNLFNPQQEYDFNFDTTIEGDVITTQFESSGGLRLRGLDVYPAGTYSLSIVSVGEPAVIVLWMYYADNNEEVRLADIDINTTAVTFTASRPFKIAFGGKYAHPITTYSYKVQLELGSVATEYAPPSNIRPFAGWDALNLGAVGKNLLPTFENYTLNGITMTVAADGTITLNGTSTGDGFTYLVQGLNLPAGNYALSMNNDTAIGSSGADTVYCAARDSAYSWIVEAYCIQSNAVGVGTTATGIVDFMLVVPAGVVLNNFKMAIQLEIGSAVTAHEAYQGNLHTVQIGQTVYGGRYKWLTGKMAKEWSMFTLNGSEYISAFGADYPHLFQVRLPEIGIAESVISSHYKPFVGSYDEPCIYLFASGDYALINDPRFSNADDFIAALAASPVQIVYKLATPVETGPFTPAVISAADPEQTNTLYGDGTIEVEYVKPLHVSIEERVAAALAAAAQTE